jgi:FSR family fosmidomycin resistance protein-like MFS transporter
LSTIEVSQPIASSAVPVEDKFHTADVAIIAAAHGTNDSFFAMIPAIQPLLIEKLVLSNAQAGLFTLFLQLPSIFLPLVGHQADRRNLRWLVILAPSLSAALLTFTGLATSYGWLALLMLAAGFATTGFHAIAPVMAASRSGNKMGRGMGLFMVGGELGFTVGPILAVSVITALGLARLPWLMTLGMASSLLLYLRFKNLNTIHPQHNTTQIPMRTVIFRMRSLMLPIMGYLFITAFLTANLINFLPTFLTSEGFSLVKSGAAFSLVMIAGTLGVLVSSWLSDQIGQKTVVIVATLVIPIFALLFLNASPDRQIPLLAGAGLLAFSANPAFLALMQRHFHQERSLANGVYMAAGFVIRSLVVFLVGALSDHFGMRTVFTASAWAAFLALPLVFFLPGEGKKQSYPPIPQFRNHAEE